MRDLATVPTLFSWQSLVWSKPLRVYNREWSCNVSAHDVLTLLSVTCHKSGNMTMPFVVHTKAQRKNRDLWYLFMGRRCARCWNICSCAQYGDNTLSWRSVHKQIYMFKESQTRMTDAQCMGHPSTPASDENLEAAWCLRTVWDHPHAVAPFSSIQSSISPNSSPSSGLWFTHQISLWLFLHFTSEQLSLSLSLSLQSLLRDSQTNHRFPSQQSTVLLPSSLSNSASKTAFLGPQQTKPHWLVTIT